MNLTLEDGYNFWFNFPKVLKCGHFIAELMASIAPPVTLPWNLPGG